MKFYFKLLMAILALIIFTMLWLLMMDSGQTNDASAVLRSIPQSFLSTTRSEAIQVSHVTDGNLLLGPREGVAHIQITAHSGIDLAEVQSKDIRREDGRMTVRMPEPRVLAVEADLASYNTVTRQSALNYLADSVRGRTVEDELFHRTQQGIADYRNANPSPARTEIVDRLNRESGRLFGPDQKVVFE